MGCCLVVFAIENNDCKLYFKNQAGYNALTLDLTETKMDESNMPLTLKVYDDMDSITLTLDSFDASVIPGVWATLDELKDGIQTMVDACYCPCATP